MMPSSQVHFYILQYTFVVYCSIVILKEGREGKNLCPLKHFNVEEIEEVLRLHQQQMNSWDMIRKQEGLSPKYKKAHTQQG